MDRQSDDFDSNITYFIDESGNTGDLILGGDDLSFGGQPYFGLGCLGVKDIKAFGAEVSDLKRGHRIQAADIKSTKIYKGKPGFVLDLVRLVAAQRMPFFIELVEKKFFVATNVAFYLIWPPYFCGDNGPKADYIRNIFAQFITLKAPNEVFSAYFKACQSQSREDLIYAFETLLSFGRSDSSIQHQHLVESVQESMNDFETMLQHEDSEENAIRRFLPEPDTSKKGKSIWILPNYSSLTNIYARINHAHGGVIRSVKLVHDAQAQFDEILFLAKQAAESSVPERRVSPIADYHFLERAELSTAKSEDSLGIQMADILTGFMVRYAQDVILYGVKPAPELKEAFHILAGAEDPVKGYGVNYVWSHNIPDAPVG